MGQDKSFKGDTTSFDVGDSVRYFTDGKWKEFGEVVQTRTHGSEMGNSHHIKNSEGKIVLRPRKHVCVLKIWALRMARKLVIAAIRKVCFAADMSKFVISFRAFSSVVVKFYFSIQ